MSKYGCSVVWSESDEGYIAQSSAFEGVSAWGETPANAVSELSVAVELAIETYEEEGWDLPSPRTSDDFSGQFRLRVPKSLHSWLAREALAEGVSLNSFVVARLSEAKGSIVASKQSHPPFESHEASLDFRQKIQFHTFPAVDTATPLRMVTGSRIKGRVYGSKSSTYRAPREGTLQVIK